MVRHDGTSPHLVAHTPKSGYISSKEQLIKDYPDCFEGIGRFPGTYKIHLKKDAKQEIHPQQKWPIVMQSKLMTKLDQMEKGGIIGKRLYTYIVLVELQAGTYLQNALQLPPW